MGYTNKTSHYDLPQWIAGDKPSWLGDVNTAMLNIDTAIAGADASASAAESSAAAANAQVQAQEAKITKNTTDIQVLTEQVADVSGVASAALPKTGGTMTGALTLAGAPMQDLQAATKKYVDDNSGKGALMLTGGTMTGALTLSGDPTSNLMAATKQYVDNKSVTFTRQNGACNGAISGSVDQNLSDGILSLNWNAAVVCATLITGTFKSSVTGQNFSGNLFVPMFHLSANPFALPVKSPTTANDFFTTGLNAQDYISGNVAVALSAYWDGSKTHFGYFITTGTESSIQGKTFKGQGCSSV